MWNLLIDSNKNKKTNSTLTGLQIYYFIMQAHSQTHTHTLTNGSTVNTEQKELLVHKGKVAEKLHHSGLTP